MSMYEKFQTSPKAEEDGVGVDFGEGLVIGVRSMRSKKVRAVNAKIAKRNQRYFRAGGSVPDDVLDADNVERTVAIIAWWKQITLVDGKEVVGLPTGPSDEPLECTPENVTRVMTDLWELREQVIGASAMAETYRAEELKAASENLSTASARSSVSAAPGA